MKHAFVALLAGTTLHAQTQFWNESFEDAGSPSSGTRTASMENGTGSPGYTAYFKRVSTWEISTAIPYGGIESSKIWAAEDVDAALNGTQNGQSATQSITWTGINPAGRKNFQFRGLFAANYAAVYEPGDFMQVQLSVNGIWYTLLNFTANPSGFLTNQANGTVLTAFMNEFFVDCNALGIPSTASSMSLRITVSSNDAGEEMAFDHFRIFENPTPPEIVLTQGSTNINDGEIPLNSSSGGYYSAQTACTGELIKTFTISNTGDQTLTLSGSPLVQIAGLIPSDFVVLTQPSASIPGGGNTSFSVAFRPSGAGFRSGEVIIQNNDANENPFNFRLDGSGTGTTPSITSVTGATVCEGNPATLGASASIGSLEWYTLPSGGSTLATGTTYITPTLSSSTDYYVQAVYGNCTSSRSTVNATVVAYPTINSVTDGTRCGTGSVSLEASASNGIINWFTSASGGSSIGTGSPFNTPSISTTTTYYAEANDGGCVSTRSAVIAQIAVCTQLNASSCNVSVPKLTTNLNCVAVSGATNYRYLVTNTSLGYSQVYTKGSNNTIFRMSYMTGLQSGTTYQVQVAHFSGGVWSIYGPACNVTTPAAMPLQPTGQATPDLSTDGDQTFRVYPNPSNGEVVIEAVPGQEFEIFDQLGRLIGKHTITEEQFDLHLNFQTEGVYLIRERNSGICRKVAVQH